jgi:hypothetical protein
MRVSTDPSDPGYEAWQLGISMGGKCHVFLDGVDQGNRVRTADEEQGFVVRDVLSDPNDPTSYVMKGEEWVSERVEGKVLVEWRPR